MLAASATLGAVVLHTLPGTVAWRSARCMLLPGLSGVGREGHVALTFDDGPDPASTPLILDELERFDWKATFFCLGTQARRTPELVEEIALRGHEVAVHGHHHRSQLLRWPRSVIEDVREASWLLTELTGTRPRWFRPPYGAVSLSSIAATRTAGLTMVLWTTWGLDWKPGATGRTVSENIARTWSRSPTVLLHDSDLTSSPGSWRATLDALPILHRSWSNQGLQVGPLRDHFGTRR